jgi:hypothetical protein
VEPNRDLGECFFAAEERGKTQKMAKNGGSDGGGSFQPRITRITRMKPEICGDVNGKRGGMLAMMG